MAEREKDYCNIQLSISCFYLINSPKIEDIQLTVIQGTKKKVENSHTGKL